MHAYKFQLRAVDLAASCLFCHSIAYTFLVSSGSVHTPPVSVYIRTTLSTTLLYSFAGKQKNMLLLYESNYNEIKLSTRRQTEVNAHMHPHTE